jgi:hypothetical protein
MYPPPHRLDAGDVGGEEVDSVAVEVAAGTAGVADLPEKGARG